MNSKKLARARTVATAQLASAIALGLIYASPAAAVFECGPISSTRTVVCLASGNPYAGGISYSDFNGPLTLTTIADVRTVGGITLIGSQSQVLINNGSSNGVTIFGMTAASVTGSGSIQATGNSTTGIVIQAVSNTVNVGSVTTTGDNAGGIRALNTGTGSTSITTTSVSTIGANAIGIEAIGSNNSSVTIRAGSVTTRGAASDGVAIGSSSGISGPINIDVNSVAVSGVGSVGINTRAILTGPVVISAGTINATNTGVYAIRAFTMVDTVSLTAGSVVAVNASGIYAAGYQGTTVVAGAVSTTGDDHPAVYAASSGRGDARVTTTGEINTSGARSQAIYAGAAGATSIMAKVAGTTGNSSDAIVGQSFGTGQATTITADRATATGAGSVAIRASSAGGGVNLIVTDRATSAQTNAIVVDAATAAGLTIGSGAIVSGGANGALITSGSGGTITNLGTIRGNNGVGLSTGATNDTIINAGLIAGTNGTALALGAGNDTLILQPGSSFVGTPDGGDGTDGVVLRRSSAITTQAAAGGNGSFAGGRSFETLSVEGGNWVLTGDQSYVGGITVAGGTLTSTGVIGGTTTISGGAAIGGTYATLIAGSGGVISPADSGLIGRLTITGNLTQGAGSTFFADITPAGANDLLSVGGIATIQQGSALVVNGTAGSYIPGQRYLVLSAAGGLNGAYSTVSVQGDAPVLTRLAYSSNALYVELSRSGAMIAALGTTSNQRSVATSIASLPLANKLFGVLAFQPSDNAVTAAFDQLSGEAHAAAHTAIVQDVQRVLDSVATRLEMASEVRGLWLQGVGGAGNDDAEGGAAEARRRSYGTLGGFDLATSAGLRLGLAGGYMRDSVKVDDRASRTILKSVQVLGYAGAQFGRARIKVELGNAWVDAQASRAVALPGFADALAASYDASVLHAFVETGYVIPVSGGAIQPIVGFSAFRVHNEGFTESGGAAALTVRSRTESVQLANAGVRVNTPADKTFSASAMAGWRHAFGDRVPSITASFSGSPSRFNVIGAPLSRNSTTVEASARWRITDRASLSFGYRASLGGTGDDKSARLALAMAL